METITDYYGTQILPYLNLWTSWTDALQLCLTCLHILVLDGTFWGLLAKMTLTIKSAKSSQSQIPVLSTNELCTFYW